MSPAGEAAGVLTRVSLTATGCVEIIYPDQEYIRDAATIHIDAIPDVHALLAFPWGKHSKEDDLPPPVVKPRGFPKDPGLRFVVWFT